MKKILGFVGVALIIAVSIISVAPTAFADNAEKQITAWFNSVSVKVNGVQVQADNLIYDGTTYVPLRAISELLGKEVKWDESTRTVEISDTSEQSDAQISVHEDSQGNTAGNLSNRGLLVADENWIYLSYQKHVSIGYPEDGLYKMKPDGSQVQKLSSQVPQYLNLDGQNLYYADNGIYKMDVNGANIQKLNEIGDTLILAGEWLYFSDDTGGIYKMKKDGSEQQKIVDEGKLVSVVENQLYYLKEKSLFVTDLTNSKETKLFSIPTELYSIPIIQGEKIYYTDRKSVYQLDLDGTNREILYTSDKDNLFSINVDDQFVLVTEGGGGIMGVRELVKIPLDGEHIPQKSGVGGIIIFTSPNNYYVSDFSAGFNLWYLLDDGKRVELDFTTTE